MGQTRSYIFSAAEEVLVVIEVQLPSPYHLDGKFSSID